MEVNLEYFKDMFCGYNKNTFPVYFEEQKILKSCLICDGTGRTSRSELTDYHKREYDTFHEDCKNCAGEGRTIVTQIYVSFGDLPYNPKIKSSKFRRLPLEEFEEPYSKESAKGIEYQNISKTFYFNSEDIKER